MSKPTPKAKDQALEVLEILARSHPSLFDEENEDEISGADLIDLLCRVAPMRNDLIAYLRKVSRD
jgi:hypothetical protein